MTLYDDNPKMSTGQCYGWFRHRCLLRAVVRAPQSP